MSPQHQQQIEEDDDHSTISADDDEDTYGNGMNMNADGDDQKGLSLAKKTNNKQGLSCISDHENLMNYANKPMYLF
jgi:hypothetical protein